MISFLATRSLSAAKSRILRATENSIVASDSAWVSWLRTRAAAAFLLVPGGNPTTLSEKVIWLVIGEAPVCGDCANKEMEQNAVTRRIATARKSRGPKRPRDFRAIEPLKERLCRKSDLKEKQTEHARFPAVCERCGTLNDINLSSWSSAAALQTGAVRSFRQ